MTTARILALTAMAAMLGVAATVQGAAITADTVRLHGTISDSTGQPVAGVEVFFYTTANIRRPADFISPKSDQAGRYAIDLPRRDYWAVARLKRGERYGPLQSGDRHSGEPVHLQPVDETSLVCDMTVADLREHAQRKQTSGSVLLTFGGRVVTPAGEPLRNVYVTAATAQTPAIVLPPYVSTWTDATGSYSLTVQPGDYALSVEKEFPPARRHPQLLGLRAEPGKLPVAIDLVVPLQYLDN